MRLGTFAGPSFTSTTTVDGSSIVRACAHRYHVRLDGHHVRWKPGMLRRPHEQDHDER